jgi:hypothetical protein
MFAARIAPDRSTFHTSVFGFKDVLSWPNAAVER